MPENEDPQAFNRYSYTYNNPVKFTDPSGHGPCGFRRGHCRPGGSGRVGGGTRGGGRGSGSGSTVKGTLTSAAATATKPGQIVVLRSRSVPTLVDRVANKLGILSKQPGDLNKVKLPAGLRIVRTDYGNGPLKLRVSDLDTGFGVEVTTSRIRLLADDEMNINGGWGTRTNSNYGVDIVTHGDLVSGREAGNPLALKIDPKTDPAVAFTSFGPVLKGSLQEMWSIFFPNVPFPGG